MVGHDAPGFHRLIDAIAQPKAEPDWFNAFHARDKYCKSLELRIAYAYRANETLAQQVISLLEQVRELNREIKDLYGERVKA